MKPAVWISCLEITRTVHSVICLRLCCVCISFINSVFWTFPQIIVTWFQIGWTRRPQRTTNYLVFKNGMHGDHWTVECVGNCAFLLEEPILLLLKNWAGICPVYISGFIVSAKEMGLIMLVALTAHYASTLVLCNGTSCINLGLSAEHYLLFWVFIWPFKLSDM
jgi:hypothetical protein